MRYTKFLIHKSKLVHFIIAPIVMIVLVIIYVCCIYSSVAVPTTININRGASVSGLANALEKNGLIQSADIFKFAVRLHGGKIQSGQYDIPRWASMWRIARMFAKGDVASTTIVIPEGLTVVQIKRLLRSNPDLTGGVECNDGNDAPVCDIKDGDLFPDTYRVARGTSRLAFLDLMRKKMADIKVAWDNAGQGAPKPLKDWNDIVTLASIVQKETPQENEMPIVASVYLNRLNKNMRLQADPTVVYALTDGLGDMQGRALLRRHLKIKSPYNTYTNRGLPPAPIANVGRNALHAVLNPADTSYLYFVADGQGGHHFSRSYKEHRKYHADWREIKKIKNKK